MFSAILYPTPGQEKSPGAGWEDRIDGSDGPIRTLRQFRAVTAQHAGHDHHDAETDGHGVLAGKFPYAGHEVLEDLMGDLRGGIGRHGDADGADPETFQLVGAPEGEGGAGFQLMLEVTHRHAGEDHLSDAHDQDLRGAGEGRSQIELFRYFDQAADGGAAQLEVLRDRHEPEDPEGAQDGAHQGGDVDDPAEDPAQPGCKFRPIGVTIPLTSE